MSYLLAHLKVIICCLSAVAYWRAFTPPTTAAKLKSAPIDGIFGRVIRQLSFISKVFVCASLVFHMAIILALYYPSQYPQLSATTLTLICPNPSLKDSNAFFLRVSQISPMFLLGCTSMISMGLLRVWCFRTLAEFFTFEITILDTHKLVQSGPYAYVRHPAYTGQILLTSGVYLMGFSRGGWIPECQVMETQVFYWVWTYIILSALGMYGLYSRGEIEDRELKKAFGKEWISYNEKVPYMFIPGFI